MTATIIGSILLADFITGLVHWFEDTYGHPGWPVLMQTFEDNIGHHEDPRSILTGTYWSRNGSLILIAVPIGLAVLPVLPMAGLAFILAAFLGNEVHAWNHGLPAPRWFLFLQDLGLAQSRRQHNQHHQRPWDRRYCTLTNLVNPVLDLGFWRVVEAILPLKVQRCSPARRGF